MATNKTMRKAASHVKRDPMLTYESVEFEFESGYEKYLKEGKRVLVFCNKRDKNVENNDLFKYFEDRQKTDKFTLIEMFYQAENDTELGVAGKATWGYFGNRCVIKTVEANGNTSTEIRFSKTSELGYRLDVFNEVLKTVDFVICNPQGCQWDDVFNIISKSGKNYALWGHQQKILVDSVRMECMKGNVWGGNTHNKPLNFYRPENDSVKKTPAFSVFTNCDVNVTKRKLFTPTKYSHSLISNGEMYKYDNSPEMFNVDRTKNIPCDFEGKLLVPISSIFALDRKFFNFCGNVNGKVKDEGIGQYALEKMLGKTKSGVLMEVTLGVKNCKIAASRCVIERKK